jgi:hypothetical protein
MTFYATNYQSKMAATLRAEAMAETKTAHANFVAAYLQRKAARNNGGHGALANRRQHARAQQNGVKFAEANGEWVDIDGNGKKHRQPRGVPRNNRHFASSESHSNKVAELTFVATKGGFACLMGDESDEEDETPTLTIVVPVADKISSDGRGSYNSPLPKIPTTWATVASIAGEKDTAVLEFKPMSPPEQTTTLDLGAAIDRALVFSTKIKNGSWADEMDSDSDDE